MDQVLPTSPNVQCQTVDPCAPVWHRVWLTSSSTCPHPMNDGPRRKEMNRGRAAYMPRTALGVVHALSAPGATAPAACGARLAPLAARVSVVHCSAGEHMNSTTSCHCRSTAWRGMPPRWPRFPRKGTVGRWRGPLHRPEAAARLSCAACALGQSKVSTLYREGWGAQSPPCCRVTTTITIRVRWRRSSGPLRTRRRLRAPRPGAAVSYY